MWKLEKRNKETIEAEAEQKIRREKVGEIQHHRGHTVFEYNDFNQTIRPADVEFTCIVYSDGYRMTGRIISQPGCRYIQALNAVNALKRINS